MIYQTRDRARVFVVALDHWKGIVVHEADAAEIKGLAARFRIDDLKRAVR